MQRNYKFTIAYDGTRFFGWERQPGRDTIQGKLESVLSRLQGSPVELTGAGRTDAGVHARAMVANAQLDVAESPEEIRDYMNRYLPEDIGVLSVEMVPDRFHSRLLAKGKTYCYQVINSGIPHVFDRRYAYVYKEKLDVGAIRRAAEQLTGAHDFAAFTSAKKSKKSTVRTIDSITIEQEGDILRFLFSGDGFLFHMVRILMGTLLEVGEGKRRPEEMAGILAGRDRSLAGPLVPAVGLTLMEVRY